MFSKIYHFPIRKDLQMNLESKNCIDALRKQYQCRYSIADLAPTICHLFGLPAPQECGGEVIPEIADQADKIMNGEGKTERAVLFCADAKRISTKSGRFRIGFAASTAFRPLTSRRKRR